MKSTLFSISALLLSAVSMISAGSSGHEGRRVGPNRHRAAVERSSQGLEKRSFSGQATYFAVGLGACGKYSVASDFIVALNTPQYQGGSPGPNCFKGITITALGKSVHAVIMDECPTCSYGSLDLSQGLFEAFTSTDAGVFQMTWSFDGDAPPAEHTTTKKATPKPTPTPTPEPEPTTTKPKPTPTPTPEPEPTTTSYKPKPTTTSSKETPTTTSAKPTPTTTKAATTAAPSSSVKPTTSSAAPTTSVAPSGGSSVNNLNALNYLVLSFGNLVAAA